MSEGALFYFEKESDLLLNKVDIKDALHRSRKILSRSNGISMKELNSRPFLKFFLRSKYSSLNVNRKRETNFLRREVRNTFASKKK